MTNADAYAQFEIVNPQLANLTSYVGASSLRSAMAHRARASSYELATEKPEKFQKYDAATKQAAIALRQDGYTLMSIASRLQLPMSTVYNMVHGRNGR